MATGLTPLESAALRAIFAETPELAPALQCQLDLARVTSREPTGTGFYTTVAVPMTAGSIDCGSVLGNSTTAKVTGLEHGLDFVLHLEDGRLRCLEGYAVAGEDISRLSLFDLEFEMTSWS